MKNLPATPVKIVTSSGTKTHTGLTKREMIAMHAMQGIMSNAFGNCTDSDWAKNIAKAAAKQADALLEELSK